MTELSDRLRVGVIGVGKMGRYHLEKFLSLPEAQVIGFFDTDADRARALTADLGVVAFPSVEELLFEVEAVVIATPTRTHASVGSQALRAGVDVLMEKPVASHLADAEALVALAASEERILQVGMVERYRLAALAKNEIFSPILYIETHRLSTQLSRDRDIDVVSDLMIHDLDLVLSLMDCDPIDVSAIGTQVLTPYQDLANVRLDFPNGAVITLNASRVSSEPVRKLRIFSASSYASFDFQQNGAAVYRRNSEGVVESQTYQVSDFDPLLEQSRQFLKSVRTRQRPLVSGEDGLRALKYAQIVLEKIHERQKVFTRVCLPSEETKMRPTHAD